MPSLSIRTPPPSARALHRVGLQDLNTPARGLGREGIVAVYVRVLSDVRF